MSLPWRQLLADVLGVTLRPVEVPDSSARGAALLGAVAAEVLSESDLPQTTPLTVGPRVEPNSDRDQLRERRALWVDTVRVLRALPFAD